MKRLCFFTILTFIFCVGGFAQTPSDSADSGEIVECVGITDDDIKNFCKNHEAILVEMENYDLLDYDADSNLLMTDDSQVKNDVENMLDKYGLSGPSRMKKIEVISLGYAYALALQEYEADPQTADALMQMGMVPDTMFQIKVHPDDLAVIKRNFNVLNETFKM